MKLSKVIFLCGSCLLLLNLTLSQAQDEVVEQGKASSSSAPRASASLTPLSQDAGEFLKIWQGTPRFINNDDEQDPLRIYEDYINQIIETDNVENFSPLISLSQPLLSIDLLQNFSIEENKEARRNAFDVLLNAWQELVDDHNAFATYFLGYLLAEQTNPEDYRRYYQRIIKNLLNLSNV
ncbi:hypothetical protein [Candidatus Odyssella acanthamoebae]|uniref:Uncharacterized protein n=1 Tax=Candidatus Odyssella acanthamoebae TaxID=91604 RepID=A0A077AWK8_9PROT|nr:hypothetical protein [Candidatus Paracaedibacter acanthamoebae]AIK96399.1 hypothetical protein ID47_06095 [Candidatus Paracaedibacter acanthamoebae]